MGIWDVLLTLLRRWYIALLALLIALGASYVVKSHSGVYWSRAEVTFLAPASTVYPNSLTTTSTDLIDTASLIAKHINGNATWNKLSDPAATIVGEGIYDGWAVHVPDYGGQWSRVFSRQVLDVQVSGPTEEDVRTRQEVLLGEISSQLAELQTGVAPGDRITATVVPDPPNVEEFHGSKARTLAMIWVLSAAGAVTAVVELERRRVRRLAAAVPGPLSATGARV